MAVNNTACFTCGKFTGESVVTKRDEATLEVPASIPKRELTTLNSLFETGNEAPASFPGKDFLARSLRFIEFVTDSYSSATQIFVGRLRFSADVSRVKSFVDFTWLEEKSHG